MQQRLHNERDRERMAAASYELAEVFCLDNKLAKAIPLYGYALSLLYVSLCSSSESVWQQSLPAHNMAITWLWLPAGKRWSLRPNP